jgi:hypothetical protein
MNNCCEDIYPEMDLTRWENCNSTQLANAENYYTKGEVDNIVDELVISGGGVTSGEVQTMINNAVATKADKSEIPVVPTNVSAFINDVPYLTQHQDLNAYATKQWVEGFTYDKETIDEKVAQGGTFDPSQYYNKNDVDRLISGFAESSAVTIQIYAAVSGKADSSAVTQMLDGYATEEWCDNKFLTMDDLGDFATKLWVEDKHYLTSADTSNLATKSELSNYALKSDLTPIASDLSTLSGKVGTLSATVETKADIEDIPTNVSELNNDANYITSSALNGYATQQWVNDQGYLKNADLSNYATKGDLSGKADTSAVTVINNTLSAHTGDSSIHVTLQEKTNWNNKVDSTELNNYMLKSKIWCGTIAQYNAIPTKDAETLYLIYED